VGAPTPSDPEHAFLPSGPFQLGFSCLPGKEVGDIALKEFVAIPNAIEFTQTLESFATGIEPTPPSVSEGSEPARPPTTAELEIKSGKNAETWATIMLNTPSTGASNWLEIWYGVITTGEHPHCFASGIEL
jgi:hypothetical protein